MPLLTVGGLPQEIDRLLRAQLFTFGIVKRWNLENSNPSPEPIGRVVTLHSVCENRPVHKRFFFYDPPHERTIESANRNELLYYLHGWRMMICKGREKQRRLPRNNLAIIWGECIRAKPITPDTMSQSRIRDHFVDQSIDRPDWSRYTKPLQRWKKRNKTKSFMIDLQTGNMNQMLIIIASWIPSWYMVKYWSIKFKSIPC